MKEHKSDREAATLDKFNAESLTVKYKIDVGVYLHLEYIGQMLVRSFNSWSLHKI